MTATPGRRRRQRLLDEAERRLWELVAASVEPLDDGRRRSAVVQTSAASEAEPIAAAPPPVAAVVEPPRQRVTVRPSPPSPVRGLAAWAKTIHVKHAPTSEGLAPAVTAPPSLARLDDRTKRRLARGSLAIEQRIDLHGMTQEAAHSALRHFLMRAHAVDARLVLVITGKGKGAPGADFRDRGVLRRAVPHWLADPSLRDLVVGFEEAHLAHGGAGAIYVRLRRLHRHGEGDR